MPAGTDLPGGLSPRAAFFLVQKAVWDYDMNNSNFMDYYIFLYFFVGILQDFLLTLNWRYINKDKAVPAALSSFIVTMVGLSVLYHILTRMRDDRSMLAIVVYAAGIATGTVLGMKFKPGFGRKKNPPGCK